MQLKKYIRDGLVLSSVIAGTAIMGSSAMAAEFIIPLNIDMPNVAALAVGMYPDYEGSDDNAFGALPALNMQFDQRYIRILGPLVQVNLINSEVFRFGPTAYYHFGRDSDIDDNVVKKVHEVDDSFELGVFAGINIMDHANPRYRYGANVDFLQDVSDGHEGYTIHISARGWFPVSKAIDLGLAGGWNYASDDYMSSFFGVTSADNASSGLAIFNAGGGSKDFYIQPMAMVHFSETWHVGIGVRIKSLQGDASDSPVVDVRGDSTQIIGGVGVAYAW